MNLAARKLSAWLKSEDISQSEFAERVRVRPSTITRLIQGKRHPSWDLTQRIFEETVGNVTPNDWISPPIERRTERIVA